MFEVVVNQPCSGAPKRFCSSSLALNKSLSFGQAWRSRWIARLTIETFHLWTVLRSCNRGFEVFFFFF